MLRELLRQNERVITLERLRYHSILRSTSGLDDTTYQACQDHCTEAFEDLVDSYRKPFGTRGQKIDTATKLITAWKDAFGGDPNDPEMTAKIDATVDSILSRRAARRP